MGGGGESTEFELCVKKDLHKVTRLGRNEKFVAVGGKVVVQDATEVRLGTARDRTIVVGQVEMRDATVESMENHALSLGIVVDAAKVVPQAKRDGRKKDTALAATAVRHRGIAIRVGHGKKGIFALYINKV